MEFFKIIPSLLQKIKIDLLIQITFVFLLLVKILPKNILTFLGIENINNRYREETGIILLFCFSFFIVNIFVFVIKQIRLYKQLPKTVGINFFKKHCTEDDLKFLIDEYYDSDSNKFRVRAHIRIQDGRKAALEYYQVIYQSSTVGDAFTGFDYNLQPYAIKLLNSYIRKKYLLLIKGIFILNILKTNALRF